MDYPETPATKGEPLHASSSPLELVCIYAQEDEQYFRKLQRHFYPWARQQKISWLEISAGEEIGATIQRHLKRAEDDRYAGGRIGSGFCNPFIVILTNEVRIVGFAVIHCDG